MKDSVLASRRHFFGVLATAVAAPIVPHRVYSFLWDNPLVERFGRWDIESVTFEIVRASSVPRLGYIWTPDGSMHEVPVKVSKDGRTETMEFVPEQAGAYRVVMGNHDITIPESRIEDLSPRV